MGHTLTLLALPGGVTIAKPAADPTGPAKVNNLILSGPPVVSAPLTAANLPIITGNLPLTAGGNLPLTAAGLPITAANLPLVNGGLGISVKTPGPGIQADTIVVPSQV